MFEHLVEAHVDDGVAFDETFELQDDGGQVLIAVCGPLVDFGDLLRQPLLNDAVVLGKPATDMVRNEFVARDIVGGHLRDVTSQRKTRMPMVRN